MSRTRWAAPMSNLLRQVRWRRPRWQTRLGLARHMGLRQRRLMNLWDAIR